MPTQTLKTVCNFVLPWLAGMILGDQEGITIRARPDIKSTRTHAAPLRTVRRAWAVLLRHAPLPAASNRRFVSHPGVVPVCPCTSAYAGGHARLPTSRDAALRVLSSHAPLPWESGAAV